MGHWLTPWIFTVLAVVELVTDQLPNTPSRKVPQQFGARLIIGALSRRDDRRGRRHVDRRPRSPAWSAP